MSQHILDGKTFNIRYPGPFYKVLSENLIHHNFKYKIGMNKDHNLFNPAGECDIGGLYFTDEQNLVSFLDFGTKLGFVKIPEDANIYIEQHKFKTDKLELTQIIQLRDFKLCHNKHVSLVQINIHAVQYVKKQIPKLGALVSTRKVGIRVRKPANIKNMSTGHIE